MVEIIFAVGLVAGFICFELAAVWFGHDSRDGKDWVKHPG